MGWGEGGGVGGKVFGGGGGVIVDEFVGAVGAGQVEVVSGAGGKDVEVGELGVLGGHRAHAGGAAVDENLPFWCSWWSEDSVGGDLRIGYVEGIEEAAAGCDRSNSQCCCIRE